MQESCTSGSVEGFREQSLNLLDKQEAANVSGLQSKDPD